MNTKARAGHELEAKVAVDDLSVVAHALNAIGATLDGHWVEDDSFFDFRDDRLKHADSALRLRRQTNRDSGVTRVLLTFKGPKLQGPFKHRREIELEVGDGDEMVAVLKALGMDQFFRYAKNRTTYRRTGCLVALDHIAEVGTFVEIEGPDEPTINAVLGELGLQDRSLITRSYLAMMIEHRRNTHADDSMGK